MFCGAATFATWSMLFGADPAVARSFWGCAAALGALLTGAATVFC